MKNFCCLLFLVLPFWVVAQSGSVSPAEFQKFRAEMRDSMQKIELKVDMGNEALALSERYADSADKMVSNFFNFIYIVFAFLGAGLVGGLVFIYYRAIDLYKKALENKFSEFERDHYDRVFETEKQTKYIKDHTQVYLAISSDKKTKKDRYYDLEKVFKRAFRKEYVKFLSLENLAALRKKLGERKGGDVALEVLVVDESLFSGLEEKDISAFFENLSNLLGQGRYVGVVVFGKVRLSASYPYLAFSNHPYTAYNNVNGLLKYMQVVKTLSES